MSNHFSPTVDHSLLPPIHTPSISTHPSVQVPQHGHSQPSIGHDDLAAEPHSTAGGTHVLHDYHMQLMQLDQQTKKRVLANRMAHSSSYQGPVARPIDPVGGKYDPMSWQCDITGGRYDSPVTPQAPTTASSVYSTNAYMPPTDRASSNNWHWKAPHQAPKMAKPAKPSVTTSQVPLRYRQNASVINRDIAQQDPATGSIRSTQSSPHRGTSRRSRAGRGRNPQPSDVKRMNIHDYLNNSPERRPQRLTRGTNRAVNYLGEPKPRSRRVTRGAVF